MEITDWLAIIGAATGTIAVSLRMRDWWYDRPHANVKVAYAYTATALGPWHRIAIKVVNKGKCKIRITGGGFGLQGSKTYWFTGNYPEMTGSDFPIWLEPRDEHYVYVNLNDLVEVLKSENSGLPPRYAWFQDATDNIYKKAVKKKNFQSWVRAAEKLSE